MRRLAAPFAASFVAFSLLVSSAAPAVAAPPSKSCPVDASGYVAVPVDWAWRAGDGLPAAGDDPAWDLARAGFAAEGWTADQVAALFGFGSVEELYGFALDDRRAIDRDANGWVCLKDLPDTPGIPAFIFQFVDDRARA
ncbi:MAG TPA: hypothetical protein VFR14_11805 [Candidatus Limnocylindrales bacterium]|nr:hypothetical protein [Candidatus Limnocylindrales bacterium]